MSHHRPGLVQGGKLKSQRSSFGPILHQAHCRPLQTLFLRRKVVSRARGSEVHPAVQSLHEAHCMNTEAQEAIKLLSAEIMEAYGLCRPLDNKMRCAEKQ